MSSLGHHSSFFKLLPIILSIFFFTGCPQLIEPEPENPALALQKAQGREVSGKINIDTAIHAFNNWNRRCETRLGNLIADAMKEIGGAQIGIMNGGGIRPLVSSQPNNLPLNTVPKGELTREQVNTIFPFQNKLTVIRLRGYRLKQMLEHSAAAVTNTVFATQDQDHDADGAVHGDCRTNGSGSGFTASGGFLQVSSGFKVHYKTANAMRVTNGATGLSTQINTQGSRVVKMVLNGITIYENPSGDFSTGWAQGPSSCTYKTTNFTNSAACSFFSLAVSDFYVDQGGDNYSMIAPASAEVASDGSVVVERRTNLVTADVLWDYLLQRVEILLPIKPVIEGRIIYE
ncbi:MAG: 5'-nucleotidase C-terminal domain-containing protein [Leptospiraceae bacterium]|nr:5'-nucleotidase C-terminal domain-containing protein [Leptospiraceae bacterium]MDW8307047.1 5'-nucleotidase [Leptospiraceae bacterium]